MAERAPIDITVHIGHVKSASTFLQKNLAANAGDRAGYTYLGYNTFADLIDLMVHHVSGGKAWGHSGRLPAKLQLDIPLNANFDRPVFASNESLCGIYSTVHRHVAQSSMTAPVMRAFQKRICEAVQAAFPTARILLVARAPAGWLVSVYRDMVRMGLSLSLDDFLARDIDVLAQWYDLDYLRETYAAAFGADHVITLPFEQLRSDRDAFTGVVEGILGRTLAWDHTPIHQGFDDGTVEALRRLNVMVDRMAPPAESWEHPGLVLKQQVAAFLEQSVGGGVFIAPSADNAAYLAKEFAALKKPLVPSPAAVRALADRCRATAALPAFAPYRAQYAQ